MKKNKNIIHTGVYVPALKNIQKENWIKEYGTLELYWVDVINGKIAKPWNCESKFLNEMLKKGIIIWKEKQN